MVQEKQKLVTSKDKSGGSYVHPITPGKGKRGSTVSKGGSVSTSGGSGDAPLICDRCGAEYHEA
jgi:hypothetical protein